MPSEVNIKWKWELCSPLLKLTPCSDQFVRRRLVRGHCSRSWFPSQECNRVLKWEGYDDDGDVMLTFKTSSVTRGMYLVATPKILFPRLADIRAGRVWSGYNNGPDLASAAPLGHWSNTGPSVRREFLQIVQEHCLFVDLMRVITVPHNDTMMSLTLMTMIMTETGQWGGRGRWAHAPCKHHHGIMTCVQSPVLDSTTFQNG